MAIIICTLCWALIFIVQLHPSTPIICIGDMQHRHQSLGGEACLPYFFNIHTVTYSSVNFDLLVDLIKVGLHYQSFCDDSWSFALVNSKFQKIHTGNKCFTALS